MKRAGPAHILTMVGHVWDWFREDVAETYGPACMMSECESATYAKALDLSDVTCKRCLRILSASKRRCHE